MLLEAELLKKSIGYLLDFEKGESIGAEGVWALSRRLYAWQNDFDPSEELFPPPPGAAIQFEQFEKDYWPDLKDREATFSDNVERAFNMCLASVSTQDWDDDRALHMLFVINPNLIIEKFCLQEDLPVPFVFEDDEIEVIHDLMINRLRTPERRMTTLNFLKKAGEELEKSGLNFYVYFRNLEKKLQEKMVLRTPLNERVISSKTHKSPALTVVPGGLED